MEKTGVRGENHRPVASHWLIWSHNVVEWITGTCGQGTLPPFFSFPWLRNTYQSTDAIRKRHLYIHISQLMQSENGIQSTDAIRKRHLYIHISRLMQSENGILLLFYIFLSHGNEKKIKIKKKIKKGDAVSYPQAPVYKLGYL